MERDLRYVSPFAERLNLALLHWDFTEVTELEKTTSVRSRVFGDVRISDISGSSCTGRRTSDHRSLDGGDYVVIVCKLEGSERSRSANGDWHHFNSNDLMIWQNHGAMEFVVNEWSRQIVILAPENRVKAALKRSLSAPFHISGSTALGALVSSFMFSFAANFDRLDGPGAEAAIEMAFDLVGSAMNADNVSEALPCRTTLLKRIMKYLEHKLDDRSLTPATIANDFGISIRYLHLLFANDGTTVAGWIRQRRLERCREEIEFSTYSLSLTEMAHRWGFSDSAHFSRLFKQRYGLPPKVWRKMSCREVV
ncbi:helix-turn-helix domain-containing protein [Agrobacterium sp. LAD9]|uniref:helix-turn-helix domain-containing protein n=1 Tax=Agrobacterium sp. LAD9 TaxID=2055153 RepID=UPI0018651380|nr:helix-turn-helix domain-containing protein [Agrobacterium sp. LAD9]